MISQTSMEELHSLVGSYDEATVMQLRQHILTF